MIWIRIGLRIVPIFLLEFKTLKNKKNKGCSVVWLSDGLILIFKSQKSFFGPNLDIFGISAK